MKGFQLEFFMEQNKRHRHAALWEWLLETARSHDIRGQAFLWGQWGIPLAMPYRRQGPT